MTRSYKEAVAYLSSREKFGIKFGLSNINQLAEALGRPERCYPSILIAGTNGKGSTAALLSSVLRAAGFRAGRYTSPHIRHLTERIQVDGEPISVDAMAAVVSRVAEVSLRMGRAGEVREPTFFEAVTACAFAYFAEQSVDMAVLEVGMGGRWDATNIVPADISVITPIGFDHEKFLGDTLGAIAAEKAAIIKEERPVVVSKLDAVALEVVREEARRKHAELVVAHEGVQISARATKTGQLVSLKTAKMDYGELELSLLGEHQLDNLVLAVRVAEIAHPGLEARHVQEGVARTTWPGRLERIAGNPPLLLDAAHNVMAAEQLGRFLSARPSENRVLLFGVMKDKRVHEMLSHLLPHVSCFVATRPEMSRARGPVPLAEWARELGTPSEAVLSSPLALARAREIAGPSGEIVVAGSIFLLGEIVEALEGAANAPRITVQTPA